MSANGMVIESSLDYGPPLVVMSVQSLYILPLVTDEKRDFIHIASIFTLSLSATVQPFHGEMILLFINTHLYYICEKKKTVNDSESLHY